jgi:hypothetical protein
VFRLARTAVNGSKKDVPGSTVLNGVEEGGMPPAASVFFQKIQGSQKLFLKKGYNK